MAIGYPPKYRYSLFEQWDKDTFKKIVHVAKDKNFPKILGSRQDKNQFLTTLIRSQKSLHDWRDLLKIVFEQIETNNIIDPVILNAQFPPSSISEDEPEWVTYEEDRIVSQFIDKLGERQIDFVGSDKEIAEFIIRFTLGQLGHDWEYTIMMIWEMLGDSNSINVVELNSEMENFDYLSLF